MQTIKIGKGTASAMREDRLAINALSLQLQALDQSSTRHAAGVLIDAGLNPDDYEKYDISEENGEPVLKLVPKPKPLQAIATA